MDHVIKVYRVPNEVIARMGPLAEPPALAKKTMAPADERPPMF
jgi:hypothetical protein